MNSEAPGTLAHEKKEAVKYFWQCVEENKPFEWQFSKGYMDESILKFKNMEFKLIDSTVDSNYDKL